MKLNKKHEKLVKKAAKDLLEKLKREKLTLDWRKRLQTRAQVMISIEQILDEELPEIYEEAKSHEKCQLVYQHIFDNYVDAGISVYAAR